MSAPRLLTLDELAREIPTARVVGDPTVVVTGVQQDSRRVAPGDVFAVRAGARAHGANYVDEALARGARALLVERGASLPPGPAPRIEVDDVRFALAVAAAAAYGHPTFALDVVGITGTNGKTTTAHLVAAAIDAAGGRAGVVGTLGHRFGDLSLPSHHTSPEADELARIAAAMVARGATHLVMEVSSIALAAARVEAVRFRVATFTNLTQDHLDYHGTMEAYAAAKARLFVELAPGAAAIHVGDPFGLRLAQRTSARVVRFSAERDADAEVAPTRVELDARGIRLRARTPQGQVEVCSNLLGDHNLANLLGALATVVAAELDVEVAAAALGREIVVPGRLERCDGEGDDVLVLVDYAHTPDALARVLAAVRPLARGEVTCVFGCGGDRDPHKRAPMGEAVGRGADLAILTSDNPRGEDPLAIARQVIPGLERAGARYRVELSRERAIEQAILGAAPGDVVLVAGKGHETYQIIGTQMRHVDDREEARRALSLRRGEGPRRAGGEG